VDARRVIRRQGGGIASRSVLRPAPFFYVPSETDQGNVMAADFVKKSFKKVVAPFLKSCGFVARTPSTYYRVRGEILDCIYIGKSQWGGGVFFVWHFARLIADPGGSILAASCNPGKRMQCRPEGPRWRVTSDSEGDGVMLDVLNRIQSESLPWFNKINSPCDFASIVDSEHGHSYFDERYILAAAMCGDLDTALVICGSSIEKAKNDNSLPQERIDKLIAMLHELYDSISNNHIDDYVAQKRKSNALEAKIELR